MEFNHKSFPVFYNNVTPPGFLFSNHIRFFYNNVTPPGFQSAHHFNSSVVTSLLNNLPNSSHFFLGVVARDSI